MWYVSVKHGIEGFNPLLWPKAAHPKLWLIKLLQIQKGLVSLLGGWPLAKKRLDPPLSCLTLICYIICFKKKRYYPVPCLTLTCYIICILKKIRILHHPMAAKLYYCLLFFHNVFKRSNNDKGKPAQLWPIASNISKSTPSSLHSL